MKKMLFVILVSTLMGCIHSHAERLYKAAGRNTELLVEPGPRSEVAGIVKRGDTLVTAPGADSFAATAEGVARHYEQVIHNGSISYVKKSMLTPIKIAGDTARIHVTHDEDAPRFMQEIYVYCDRLLNAQIADTDTCLWFATISIALMLLLLIVAAKLTSHKVKLILYIITGILLVGTSVAELLYFATATPTSLWFVKPSYVGWGLTILNIILFSLLLGIQFLTYYGVASLIGTDEQDKKRSIASASVVPVFPIILAVVIFIMFLVDSFGHFNWPLKIYAIVSSLAVLPALVVFVEGLIRRRIISAIFLPLFLLTAGTGLVITMIVLGFLLFLVAILATPIMLLLGLATAPSGKKEGNEIVLKDEKGNLIEGKKDAWGNFKADDGRRFKKGFGGKYYEDKTKYL